MYYNEKYKTVYANNIDEYINLYKNGHSPFFIKISSKYHDELYSIVNCDNNLQLLKVHFIVFIRADIKKYDEAIDIINDLDNDDYNKYLYYAYIFLTKEYLNYDVNRAKKCFLLAAELKNGIAAWEYAKILAQNQIDDEVIKYYFLSAEDGYPYAYNILGTYYAKGEYLKKDIILAIEYYIMAAKYNFSIPHYNVALLYEKELHNYVNAYNEYKIAANMNHLPSMHKLGDFFIKGLAGKIDYEQAFYYYEKSAELGYLNSLIELGRLHYYGIGCQVNMDKALQYFLETVEKNSMDGARNAGITYSNEMYRSYDNKKAIIYFNKAIELGSEESKLNLLKIYKKDPTLSEDTSITEKLLSDCLNSSNINLVISTINYLITQEKLDANKINNYLNILSEHEKDNQENAEYLYIYSVLLHKLSLYKEISERIKLDNEAISIFKKIYDFKNKYLNSYKIVNKYGIDFFNDNIENDFFILDQSKIKQSIHGCSTAPNNNSYEIWRLRAAIVVAIIEENDNEIILSKYYKALMDDFKSLDDIKENSILYPNAAYMIGKNYELGLSQAKNINLAKSFYMVAADRFHAKSSFVIAHMLENDGYQNKDKIKNYYKNSIEITFPYFVNWAPVGFSPNALGNGIGGSVYGNVYKYKENKKPSIDACLFLLNFDKNSNIKYHSYYDMINLIPKSLDKYIELVSNSYEANAIFKLFDRLNEIEISKIKNLIYKYKNDLSNVYAYIYAKEHDFSDVVETIYTNLAMNNNELLVLKEYLSQTSEKNKYEEVLHLCTRFDESSKIEEIIYFNNDKNNCDELLIEYAKKGYELAIIYVYEKTNDLTYLKIGVDKGYSECKKIYTNHLIKEGYVTLAYTYDTSISENYIYNYLMFMNSDFVETKYKLLGEKLKILGNAVTKIADLFSTANIILANINNYFYDIDKNYLKKVIQIELFYLPAAILLLACGDKKALLNIAKYYERNIDHASYIYDLGVILDEKDKNIYLYNKSLLLISNNKFANKSKGKKLMKALAKEKYLPAIEYFNK